jgi:hypothetical protein
MPMARRVPGDSPVDGAPLAAGGGGGIGSRIGGVLLALGLAGRLFAGPLGLVGALGLGPGPLAGRNFLDGDGGGGGRGRRRRGGNRGRRWLRRSSLHDRSTGSPVGPRRMMVEGGVFVSGLAGEMGGFIARAQEKRPRPRWGFGQDGWISRLRPAPLLLRVQCR